MFRLFVLGSVVSSVFLAAAAVLGLTTPVLPRDSFVSRHVLPGLLAVLLGCFLLSMGLFYFFGIAGPVREALANLAESPRFLDRSARLRRTAMAWSLCGIVSLMATAILGGAADGMFVSAALHGWTAALAVLLAGAALAGEVMTVRAQRRLMDEIEGVLERQASPVKSSPEGEPGRPCSQDNPSRLLPGPHRP
ncbi:MAG: hypothetical protein HYU36_05610 [Planctomycetes bacterium]|nr:hypothetical protein [Planctomycetota bacterium]